jgi:hypothetical protein
MEWTKEFGIVIASHKYVDNQIVRDCIDNARTIKKYAQKAKIWPLEENISNNQVLHNLKLYATDGSFTVKTAGAKDIIASKQTLRDAGEGTEGIELMPRNPTNMVLDLHIKSDKPQPGTNAYTWQLLTAVVRLHLVKFMPSSVRDTLTIWVLSSA